MRNIGIHWIFICLVFTVSSCKLSKHKTTAPFGGFMGKTVQKSEPKVEIITPKIGTIDSAFSQKEAHAQQGKKGIENRNLKKTLDLIHGPSDSVYIIQKSAFRKHIIKSDVNSFLGSLLGSLLGIVLFVALFSFAIASNTNAIIVVVLYALVVSLTVYLFYHWSRKQLENGIEILQNLLRQLNNNFETEGAELAMYMFVKLFRRLPIYSKNYKNLKALYYKNMHLFNDEENKKINRVIRTREFMVPGRF
ncbi:MAG: hypothetical protein IT244_04770 [Bacteroidia bacterium]|nr:hypothetical protein [Bacteroidia bacterium]